MSFKSPKSAESSPQSTRSNNQKNKTQILFDDYEGSEFEYPVDSDQAKKQPKPVLKRTYESAQVSTTSALPSKNLLRNEQDKAEGQIRSYHFRSMNAYAKHIKLVNDYLQYYSGGRSLKEVFQRDISKDRTDLDVIREEMKFIWDESDVPDTWERRLAKRYYDKLFKEYCICDLTLYKQNKIAMRWRVEKEVLTGKGQFICGDKKCNSRESLKTWEVNFGYMEHGEKKNALVKLRLCPDCSLKLNFHHKKKEYIKPAKEKTKKKQKSSKEVESSQSEEESSSDETEKKEIESSKSKKVKKSTEEEATIEKNTSDGNMIILNADDSMWKNNASEKLTNIEDGKAREEEFEEYLEDLFM